MRHHPKKTTKRRTRRKMITRSNQRFVRHSRRSGFGWHGSKDDRIEHETSVQSDMAGFGAGICPCCGHLDCKCDIEMSEDGSKGRCETHCKHEGFHSLKAGRAYIGKRRDKRQRTRIRAQERGRPVLKGLISSPSNPVSNAQITAAARDLAAFLRANGRPLTAKNVRFAVDDSTMGLTPQQRAKYIVETCSNLGIETYEVI